MADETDLLIRTKLHRPQLPTNLVTRPWLLEWLNQHRRRPLTLVSASAGYGKTTLISSWLEAVGSPSAWVSLDEHDDNLIVFLTYFIAATQTIFPQAGQKTLALLNAPHPPSLPVLTRTLSSELEQLPSPFILVLDDYHVIHEAAIHDLLSELLRHPPPAMHLVVSTRSDPPLPITKFRAHAQVTEIRPQELRFTASETATFLQQGGIQVDDATAAYLAEKTEGWVTGLRLVTLSLRHRGDIDLLLKSLPENAQYVTDYLLTEVLNRLDPAIQDFLLKTSILNRFCSLLCDYVTELDEPVCDGLAYLVWLLEQNLFTIPLDDQHHWYRYHPLFQQLLQWQLELKLKAEGVAALHLRASAWYAENGFIDDAFRHALTAGDLPAAAHLVEQNVPGLLNKDKWSALEQWMAKLPDPIIQQRPKLLLAKAWVAFHHFALWAIPSILETVEIILDDEAARQPLWGEVDFFWGHHWFWQGQNARSLDLFNRALERIPKTYHLRRGEVELFWGLASQMCGQKKEAVRALNQWLYYEQPSHPGRQSRLLGSLIFIYLLSGELTEAALMTQQLRDLAAQINNAYLKAWASYLQAHTAYCRNDRESAAHHFAEAVEGRYIVHTRDAIDSLAGLTLTYQALGQLDNARATLGLLLEFAQERNDPAYLMIARSCQARLALLQGDTASAVRWLQTADLTMSTNIMFYWLEIPTMTQCRVLIAQGSTASLQEATERLLEYEKVNEAEHNTHQLIDNLLLQALAYHKLGQLDEALTLLERAVTLAQLGGFIRPFVETGPELAGLLNQLARQGVAPDYIGQILKAFPDLRLESDLDTLIQNQREASKIENPLVESLSNRELDVLELLAQRFSNKEIAAKLFISPLTVKTHTANIYQKLEANNRRQAVNKARALGLISDR